MMNKLNFVKNLVTSTRGKASVKMDPTSIDDRAKIGDAEVKGKSRSESLDFAYIYWPVYYFSRVFGLMPFSIKCNPNKDVQKPTVTAFDCVWFIIATCLYLTFATIAWRNMILPENKDSPAYLILFGDYVLLIIGLIVGAIVISMDMYNRIKIVDILKLFNTFDDEVATFGIHFNYVKDRQHTWAQLISGFVVFSILFATTYIYWDSLSNFTTLDALHLFGAYIFQYGVTFLTSISYIILLANLQKRFAALNHVLRSRFMDDNMLKLSFHFQKEECTRVVKFIGRHHSFLNNILDNVNSCFSFQIMFDAAYTFVFSVLGFYTFFRFYQHPSENYKDMTWVHFKWGLLFFILILMVIYTAHRVSSEGKKTSQIVHDIINSWNEADVVAFSLTQLSQQLQHRKPVASCGLFEFDWPLLFTMGAATTTYLTILFSFGPSQQTT